MVSIIIVIQISASKKKILYYKSHFTVCVNKFGIYNTKITHFVRNWSNIHPKRQNVDFNA